jgi:glycosyltransferase involved in cell wall biosynthesis
MTTEMRILFVTTNKHLPELCGGMEVNTHELSLALCERGVSVGVLCGLAGVGLTGISARLRSKILCNPCPRDSGLGYPTWRSYDIIPHVGSVVAAFKPDILVVQGGADFVPLVTTCLGLGRAVVCYLHTQDRLLLPQDITGHPKISFIANSNFTRSMHSEKQFLGVVPPLVAAEDYTVASSRKCAVFINPVPYKGLDIVVGLAEARADVPFLFVVNRRRFNRERPEQRRWNRLRNIRAVGPFRDMRRVYRHAKLVLAPSQWLETWGRIATEAHFSGIPVLASDRGGLPEAVGPGGICLPAKAPFPTWLEAFTEIWDNPTRYKELCDASRKYAGRREISRDTIVGSFLALLNACCAITVGQAAGWSGSHQPLIL